MLNFALWGGGAAIFPSAPYKVAFDRSGLPEMMILFPVELPPPLLYPP
ncbi:hypothetical protein IXZ16_02525 [Campylobacter fetus subsp. fetus]|nr:hypothetical protein [Campylobacter sp. TJR-1]EKJ0568391.1 hypothetical protein [Campylobacter fetus]MDV2491092.1 hypothetical protein [Campylobacter sp. TJR-1]WKW19413.1 hypothetical protein IXZ16_02525 [Campylobacter fetus subsp. fetus]